MFKSILPLLCGLSLVACDIVGPNYVTPNADVPHRFVGGGSADLRNASSSRWWTGLNDPLLSEFVERANAQNLTVQLAIERIRAAQAAAGTAGVNSLSSGALTASATRGEVNGIENNNDTVQLNAGYVFDLFGGGARSVEQAEANIEASQYDVGTARLGVLSQLTNAYIQARYFQEAGAITRSTIQSRRETLNLVRQRRDAGEATELEVQQARANLANSEASLPILEASFESNVYAIATLLAEPASQIRRLMSQHRAQPRPNSFTDIGVPADLLRNRPDVRSAERSFAAATAAIGVNEARLYPSVSISGAITAGTNETWSLGPSLNIPLLNRGVLKSNVESAESAARQAELNYRQTVLTSIEEVQQAIVLCLGWNRQLNSQDAAVRAANSVLRLSRESYRGGAITLTEVLDAERQVSNSRLGSADALRNFAASWVQVQIATGKGWRAESLLQPAEVAEPEVPVNPLGLTQEGDTWRGDWFSNLFNTGDSDAASQ